MQTLFSEEKIWRMAKLKSKVGLLRRPATSQAPAATSRKYRLTMVSNDLDHQLPDRHFVFRL